MTEYSDKQILEMYADDATRHQAFEHLVEKYSKRIYWVIRKIVISHHDADDIVQNVFIKLWSSLPSFRGEAGLYTWIYRIAVNESLSVLRSRKNHFFSTPGDTSSHLEQIEHSEGLTSGEAIELAMQRAIERLPDKQRAVFTLRYYDEMPYEEMSKILGTSVGALKASYHHAVQKIEDTLKKENFLQPD